MCRSIQTSEIQWNTTRGYITTEGNIHLHELHEAKWYSVCVCPYGYWKMGAYQNVTQVQHSGLHSTPLCKWKHVFPFLYTPLVVQYMLNGVLYTSGNIDKWVSRSCMPLCVLENGGVSECYIGASFWLAHYSTTPHQQLWTLAPISVHLITNFCGNLPRYH